MYPKDSRGFLIDEHLSTAAMARKKRESFPSSILTLGDLCHSKCIR